MTYPLPAEHFPPFEIPEAANDAHWLIARTLPRGEFRAMKALNDLGIMAYCPCETKWRKTAKGKERVRYPLFQGYVFLSLPMDSMGGYVGLHQARSADGVSGIVKGPSGPVKVPHVAPTGWVNNPENKPRKRFGITNCNADEMAGKFDYAKDRNAAKEAVTSIRMSWEQFASVGRDLIMDAVEGKIELANLAENMQEAA